MSSPTQRTRSWLKANGWLSQIVETMVRIPGKAPFRRDLFNFVDILALGEGQTLAIQVTSGPHSSNRRTKILCEARSAALLAVRAGWLVEVHAWRKVGPRGRRKLWRASVHRLAICQNGELFWMERPEIDQQGRAYHKNGSVTDATPPPTKTEEAGTTPV